MAQALKSVQVPSIMQVGLRQSQTESSLLSKIGTITSASQDYCGGVNEITHIKCSGQAWHTVNVPHRREFSLWFHRHFLSSTAGPGPCKGPENRGITLWMAKQWPPARWGNSLINNNTRQGDAIAKKRRQPHAQRQITCSADPGMTVMSQSRGPVQAWRGALTEERNHTKLRDWPSFLLQCSLPCFFSPNSTQMFKPQEQRPQWIQKSGLGSLSSWHIPSVCAWAPWLIVWSSMISGKSEPLPASESQL